MHKKRILAGLLLPIVHFLIVIFDARLGWLGGGPEDANIGLGLFGLFIVWPISLLLIIEGLIEWHGKRSQ